ncbi:digalactosyldiacylglycerol synthase [Thalassobaculum litoreum DSM 18839]|uniref:Digalactosyldiacylglycerol synthase n=2 Tax=Thalassobaculum TaxID=526215 RepID=A0A8G2BL95_9PROT|nr:digalactosyldiacylglycerol synthase [Thalassobaculum litoreum DSM 18839]
MLAHAFVASQAFGNHNARPARTVRPRDHMSTIDRCDYDVTVVTTASLPWLTGPAYLSLHQAIGLTRLGYRVAYGVPWVEAEDQDWLWGTPIFACRQAHRDWLLREAEALGCEARLEIFHYRAEVWHLFRSIVPKEDVIAAAPSSRALVMIEPEHLTWKAVSTPRPAADFERVIGVVMTNYGYYIARQPFPGSGLLARWVTRLHRFLIRRYTDLAIPISPAVADVTAGHPGGEARVTGVYGGYAEVPPVTATTRGAYFIGRLVWEKGLEAVIDIARLSGHPIDVIGNGPDEAAIRALATQRSAPLRFLGPTAEAWRCLTDYRVFVNPSASEVLCSTTAEALVAGRHVVLYDCPANEPFRRYPNTHFFSDTEGALAGLRRALSEAPQAPDLARREFDWLQACRTLAAFWEDASRPPAPTGRAVAPPSPGHRSLA